MTEAERRLLLATAKIVAAWLNPKDMRFEASELHDAIRQFEIEEDARDKRE